VHDGVADLAEIVRGNVGGHADRDALRSVDQQIGEPRRQDIGLTFGTVVVGREIDSVFVDAVEQSHGEVAEAALGVALGGRREVGRTVVTLEVDQRVAQREGLRHADERVVDRGVAVRVIVTHHVAGDARALDAVAIGAIARVEHAPENAAMHGLEAIAHVGQRAADDDRHRVVQERAFHLFLDFDHLHTDARATVAAIARTGPASGVGFVLSPGRLFGR
jgi:hypothetical protein